MTSKRKRQQEIESDEEEEIPNTQIEESDEEEAPKLTQKSKKRKDKTAFDAEDGKNLEAGIIEEIKLKNFMCHPNFKVEFHDRTTIIHGENGSGKSAVLTAIQVGLGSKAKNTNRGNSIKDLVMSGKEHAEIMIRLRNQGRDAYKKELYGRSIIIVKGISKAGSTTLKIQNSQGKTISKSSKELAIILHSFNIQIENPTTCMTQDISREFLAGSSEAKKYQFFLRATQIKDMEENIAQANKNNKIMEDMYADKISAFQESTEELKKREDLYKETTRIDELRNDMTALQSERGWAIYHKNRVQYEGEVKLRDALKRSLDELIEKKNSSSGTRISELTTRKFQIDEEIESIGKKIYLLNQEASNVLNKKRDIETRAKNSQQTRQKINREITALEQEIQLFDRNKNETLSKNKTDKESAIKSKQEEIDKIQSDIDKIEENKKQYEEEATGIKVNREKLTTQQNQTRHERGSIEEDIRKLQDEESKLKQSRTDKFAMVGGAQMKNFLSELSKSKNFSKPPIGPLGLLLSVKEEYLDWAAAIEQFLIKNLNGFIVDNFKDGEELNRIKKKTGVKFTHIIQQYTNSVYDLSKVLPHGHTTIYHTLDVDLNALRSTPLKYDDTEVLRSTLINMLINQSRVERNVLIQNLKEAQSFIDQYPQYEAITITGTRVFRKGGSAVTDVANAPRSKLWTKSVEEEIQARVKAAEELRKKVKEVEVTEKRLRSEADRLYESLSKLTDSIKTSSKKIDSLKVVINKKKKDIDEIANEEDNDQQFIEELEGKIKICQDKIASNRERLKEEEKKMEDLKIELNELNQQAAESRQSVMEAQQEKETRDREVLNILKQIEDENRNSRTMDNEIFSYRQELEKKEREVTLSKELMDRSHDTASDGCPYIETNADPRVLGNRIDAIKKLIDREQQRLGNINASDVKKDYLDYKRTYDEKKLHLEVCRDALKMAKEGVNSRTRTMLAIRSSAISTVSQFFGRYMSQKGHSGQIEVEDGDLKFIIHMATHGSHVTVKDAKSLSGGEKSFTTVSFLLSIWELVETPFRAVDEFDVFMDNMYRKTAMDLILKTAKAKHPTRQLIIITPQDVSIVDKDPEFVKIIKLKAPQRDENQRSMEEFIHNHQM